MPSMKRPQAALIAVFALFVAAVAFAGPANAAPYTSQATCSVSDQTPAAGSSLTLSCSGFGANETVNITLHSHGVTVLAPGATNASGAFSTTVTLPAGVTGTHTLTAVGATSGRTASVSITIGAVTSAGGPTGGGLPFTGAAVMGISSLAVLLLLGGVLMVFTSRRRRTVIA